MKTVKKLVLTMAMCMTIFNLKALSVGDQAPDFSLLDEDNKTRTLTEYKGKYVALYFYPKDDTPGCTKEACQIRDKFEDFKKQDIVVLGVNYDSPKSHKKFKEKYKLSFTLLSDSDKKVAKKYGAKNWWFIPVPYRMTFIIDPKGIVCSILPSVDVSTHAGKVLEIVQNHKQGKK